MEKETVSIFDIIYDENNTQNIVLYNEKEEPVDFEQIAFIPLEEKDYVILKPINGFESLGEDEALVFEMVEEDNEQNLIMVVDDEILDAVFEEYNKLYDEQNGNK